VLKRLRDKIGIPISVDTYKSQVAGKALEHGADIINDPTGLMLDLQLTKVVNKYGAGLIINHMRGMPDTWARLGPLKNLMRSIAIDLEAAVNRARQAGIEAHQIVLDPGLGFGKRREQNSEIIARLRELRTLEMPLMIGPSRKSFLRKEDKAETEFATAAAVTASILNGVHIVRVHDVKAMRSVADVADIIVQAGQPEEEEEKPFAAPPRQRRLPALGQGTAPPIKRPPARRADSRDNSGFRADPTRRGE
jgi:dihydropteroate synthase